MNAASSTPDAATTYAGRTASLSAEAQHLHRQHLLLGWARLFLAISFVVLLFPPRWYALLPLLLFVVAARLHAGVLARLTATRRRLGFFAHGTARLEDRWMGLRPRPCRRDLSEHLYAEDLDLVGDHGLFELLCEARTSLGEEALLSFLLDPDGTDRARARQTAVRELRDRLDLRESLAAAPGPDFALLDRETLTAWAALPPVALPAVLRVVAPVLVLLTAAAAWRYATAHTPVLLIGTLLLDAALTFGFQSKTKPLLAQASAVSQSLHTVAHLCRLLEAETFSAPLLVELQGRLRSVGASASTALRTLARYDRWAEERGNYLVRVLDTPFLYSVQLALAVEAWRRRHKAQLGPWLDAVGHFEALLSLASYTYEHPDDTFPELLPHADSVYLATALGHPLLPAAACVRNDLTLGRETRLLLVSGSNMSGKSTLLRSVGVSIVMAFAGAPVRATGLAVSALTLAASIHVNDSLQAGRSRFYAEILRLRAIAEAARRDAVPLLFLLDEVLAGTNSSDRLAGARGLARDLLDAGALGIMSTHDLTLTGLSVQDAARIRNAHFEDQIADSKLSFDYKLRPGVLQRSNGVALMRLIGLKV